jgi:hypothetical protein
VFIAAEEGGFFLIEPVSPLLLFRAVAFGAIRLQNRLNVPGKVDGTRGGRREFRGPRRRHDDSQEKILHVLNLLRSG